VGERKNGKGERRNGRWSEGGRKKRKMRKAVGNGKTRVIHRSAVGMGILMGWVWG